MPSITVPVSPLAFGPGYLFWAPLATSLPAHTVATSIFTDAWPGAWLALGATVEGHTFNSQYNSDTAEVAEYIPPVSTQITGVDESVEFALALLTATNLKRAMNGGTITVTGSGATTLNKFAPPDLSTIVRCMLGWESLDNTERWVAYQTLQTGQIAIPRRKGAEYARIPCTFTLEQPASGDRWDYWSAGPARG